MLPGECDAALPDCPRNVFRGPDKQVRLCGGTRYLSRTRSDFRVVYWDLGRALAEWRAGIWIMESAHAVAGRRGHELKTKQEQHVTNKQEDASFLEYKPVLFIPNVISQVRRMIHIRASVEFEISGTYFDALYSSTAAGLGPIRWQTRFSFFFRFFFFCFYMFEARIFTLYCLSELRASETAV